MRVVSPVNIAILHHFREEGLDHFTKNTDGSVDLFKMEECDYCGGQCRGANPVVLEKVAFPKEQHKALLLVAGFEPSSVIDELGCNDSGDAVCPNCYEV